jgi:hypothetical protein
MNSHIPKLAFAALVGACLFACNSPSETVVSTGNPDPVPETGNGFDRSALAIKASSYTVKEKTAAMEALASRYGIILAPQGKPALDPELPEADGPGPGALAKSAAVSQWSSVKWATSGNNFALYDERTVLNNQTLSVWTTRPDGSTADPFIVGTYTTFRADFGDALLLQVVGLNDDDANPNTNTLDSRFVWKNTTGSTKQIQLVAFPFSPQFSGTVTLNSLVGGVSQSISDDMEGFAIYENNIAPPPGCRGLGHERLKLTTEEVGDFLYIGMIVNAQTMTGARIINGGLLTSQTISLPTPTPNGYPNFTLAFAGAKNLGGRPAGRVAAKQQEQYSCPN